MKALLAKLLQFPATNSRAASSRVVGYSYVPESSSELMKEVQPGEVIKNSSDAPPWIVVDKSLNSVVVAKWPGHLWRVEVLRLAGEQPRSTANYVRAVEVKVVEELPLAQLFGAKGEAVVRVIESARTMNIQHLAALLQTADKRAVEIYSEAWNRWLSVLCRLDPIHAREEHSGTLAVSGTSTGSPVGSAFKVLYSVLRDRALALVGNSAFIVDEDGNEFFVPEWVDACGVFLCAIMGYGADGLLSADERQACTAPWRAVFARAAS